MTNEWENHKFWENYGMEDYYQKRTKLIKQLIPQSAKSIVDIGTGKAEIINVLPRDKFIVGLDKAHVVQEYNINNRLQASSSNIPLSDLSFDVSMCLEVLEHLTDEEYKKTLGEIIRITKKEIIIGVPYNENIEFREVVCPRCRYIFNADGHKRSFKTTNNIDIFLDGFTKIKEYIIGPHTYYPPNQLLKLIHRLGIYMNWEDQLRCNNCGYSKDHKIPNIKNIVFKLMKSLKIFGGAYPYWLIIHYERQ